MMPILLRSGLCHGTPLTHMDRYATPILIGINLTSTLSIGLRGAEA